MALLIIGMGGVGKSVLYRLRKRIVEEYGRLETVKNCKFLHLDTFIGDDPGVNVLTRYLGEDLTFRPDESIVLSQNLDSATMAQHPAVKAWFPENLPININFRDGAGGTRPFGKIAFHYNVDRFRETVNRRVQELTDDYLDVYVVCSLFGGTGSGSFLDVCYNARDVVYQMRDPQKVKLFGYFIIGAQKPNNLMKANCYGALMEMEYYHTQGVNYTLTSSLGGAAPFTPADNFQYKPFQAQYPVSGMPPLISHYPPTDFCHLFSHANKADVPFNRDQLEEAVAQRLFFDITPGIGDPIRAKVVDSIAANPEFNMSVDSLQQRAKNFWVAGSSLLELPIPRLINALACGWAAYACEFAKFPRATGQGDPKGEADSFIKELDLTEKRLKAELVKRDTGTLINNLAEDRSGWLNELSAALEKTKKATAEDEDYQHDAFLSDVDHVIEQARGLLRNGSGSQTGPYYLTIQNNKNRLRDQNKPKLKKKIQEMVGDRMVGPTSTAGTFLPTLSGQLQTLLKKYSNIKSEIDASMRQADTRVTQRRQRIDGDKGYFWEMGKQVEWLCNRELSLFLKKGLDRAVAENVTYILGDINSDIGVALNDVRNYLSTLETLKVAFLEKMWEVLESLQKFGADPLNARLQQICEGIIREGRGVSHWNQNVEGIFQQIIVPLLDSYNVPFPHSTADLFADKTWDILNSNDVKGTRPLFETVIQHGDTFRNALFQACRAGFACLGEITLPDVLMRLDETVRRTLLRKKIKDSAVLGKINTTDITIRHDPALCDRKFIMVGNNLGLTEQDHPIWAELADYDPAEERVNSLKQPYRMVFVEGSGVFALRNLGFLQHYAISYRADQEAHSKRHSDKTIDFPELFPPDPRLTAISQRAEVCYLLSLMLGLLKTGVEPETEEQVIFYRFTDPQTKIERELKLCHQEDAPVVALQEEQAKKDISQQTSGQTPLERLEKEIAARVQEQTATRTAREKLRSQTEQFMGQRQTHWGDERHAAYQRELAIISEFCRRYNLLPA
ncbi:MAG: hypothetical protein NTW80_10675 [Deltaproteobacteria bacterium]|nr:hypothetical protein [Deltaproteobacteria bacterium]